MEILLVDDDDFYAQVVKEYLEDNGCECVKIRTSHEAMQIYLAEYACAVIDVMLPNDPSSSGISEQEARGGLLTGVSVTRRFRQTDADFPVVLLSSGIAGGEAQRWAQENAVPFVFKHEHRGKVLSALAEFGIKMPAKGTRVFIVHGHDQELLMELKDYI